MAGTKPHPPTIMPSKRKPPTPRGPPPSSSSKSRPSRHIRTPHHTSDADTSASMERSQRGGQNYRTFAFPERRAPHRTPDALKPSSSKHPTTANKHYVFVYGTLKSGLANAHLLDRATCIGEFRTVTRYPLVVVGKHRTPYLLDMPSKGWRVKGELYVVDDAVLADLDHLEKAGVAYTRRVTKVSSTSDRSFVANAFVYFKTDGLQQLANNEFLEDYQVRKIASAAFA